MFKQITTVFALMISAFTFSQVGIDTPTPKATLDVVGKADDTAAMDGIIAPRIEGTQLRAKTYTSAQTGALVYVTLADTAPAGQTIDVTAAGYYYFNGTKWVITGGNDVNIYKDNGTLTSNRMLMQDNKTLTFSNGTGQSTTFSNNNGVGIVQRPGATGRSSMGFYDSSGSSSLWLYTDNNGFSQILASTNATGLNIGTNSTINPTPITFSTSSGGGDTGARRMIITGAGNVGMNTNNPSTVARLHIIKTSADITPAIIEGCNVYADNAAAATAGVPVGGLYRKADGTLMVRF